LSQLICFVRGALQSSSEEEAYRITYTTKVGRPLKRCRVEQWRPEPYIGLCVWILYGVGCGLRPLNAKWWHTELIAPVGLKPEQGGDAWKVLHKEEKAIKKDKYRYGIIFWKSVRKYGEIAFGESPPTRAVPQWDV
jgi:hypothetical protein